MAERRKRLAPKSRKPLQAKKSKLPVLRWLRARNPTPTVALPPGLPSVSRPTAGHLGGAFALVVVITGIYGVIEWGMFNTGGDFGAHIAVAQLMYETHRPLIPHFLFHALTAALFAMHLAPSIVFAGRIVLLGGYGLLALIAYGLLWIVFRASRIGRPAILFLAGLAMLLAEPLTHANDYVVGFLWPETYVSPTYALMRPFALASFLCTAWYLFRRCRIDIRLVSLFALATFAGSLTKPSFIICLLPASGIIAIYRLIRRLPVSRAGLAAGMCIPAGAVLGWQFYASYSGRVTNMYHDSVMWAPFKVMNHWGTDLFARFLVSLIFPLLVSVVYWKKVRLDGMLQLAWLCFFFGCLYTYMVAENTNWAAGNFVWSGYITTFTLFVAAVVFWLREIASPTPTPWDRARQLLCGCAIALHAASGARLDWYYLKQYACRLNLPVAKFICHS